MLLVEWNINLITMRHAVCRFNNQYAFDVIGRCIVITIDTIANELTTTRYVCCFSITL